MTLRMRKHSLFLPRFSLLAGDTTEADTVPTPAVSFAVKHETVNFTAERAAPSLWHRPAMMQ